MRRLLTDWSRWTMLAAVFCAALPSNPAPSSRKQGQPPGKASPPSSGALHGAQVSPDGAWVIYAADSPSSGSVELYRVPLAGGSDALHLGGPVASASGYQWAIGSDARVVYIGQDLFSVPLDGSSSPVRLDEHRASGTPSDFALVPGVARVVYRAAPAGRYLGLFSVPTDGHSRPIELVAPNTRGDVGNSYRIGPDGHTVVFLSRHGDGVSARLYSAPIDGGSGSVVALTPPRFEVHDFQVSPDGAHVVYRGAPANGRGLELYRAPIDGGMAPQRLNAPLLRGKYVQDFGISPDGVRVVYLAEQGNGRNELFTVPMDGSSPALRLAQDVAASFQFHPSNRAVLYKADRNLDERFELFGVAIDGSSTPLVINAPLPPQGHVGWFGVTPDGARIVYQAYRGADHPELVSELWQVAAARGIVRTKLAETAAAEGFQISADGRRLLYRDEGASLCALALAGGSAPDELEPGFVESGFRLSPDGGSVVYCVSARPAPGQGSPGSGLFSRRADGSQAQVRLYPPSGARATTAAGPGGTAQASAGDGVGFRDFSFGTTGTSTPSGEKPECKLWWNDGSWWGSLYVDAAQDHHIHRFDLATQSWVDTGTVLDDRTSSKADVLWDAAAQKLYVASHIFTTNAQPTASNWGRLLRYSYSAATRSYTRDADFPTDITRGNAEALTIAKDSQGRLWATWVEASRVMVNHSLASDSQWGTPVVLPAGTTSVAVTSDDISAILAFGNSVGILWSNQNTFATYFAVHRDGDADTQWREEEVVIPDGNCAGQCADDLFSLKTDASGRVFVVLKTSQTTPDQPLNLVTVREPSGVWNSTVFGLVSDHHTRPILLLDEQNDRLYVFATHPESGGAIYYKSTPIDDIHFDPGLGTPFIQNSVDVTISNATSTKQNLNNLTDLLVLASDQNTRFYLHNFLDLGPSGNEPSIASFTPTSGTVGAPVTIAGSNFTDATSVKFNGAAATFITASSTRIESAVPSGATSGRITVSSPDGTATSNDDFTVLRPPSISSFAPTSGPVGTPVTITGNNFIGTTGVRFNGTTAAFTVASNTQIRTTVPSGAITGKISVITREGTATSSHDFRVTRPPSITSFTPTSGAVGTPVTISGGNFTGATSVRFNGTAAVFTVQSSAQIDATVPSGATTGKISVTNLDGTATSSSDFTVTQSSTPVIDSFTPTSGPVGTAVTITGNRFAGTTSVRFNGTTAAFFVASNTQIDATVPPGATTGRISVSSPDGTATSASDFTVTHPPSITSFTPTSGPVGTAVTITGNNFTGTTSVRFNGTAALFTVTSSTQINATVPAAATSGKISVTNPEGSATSAGDFTVTRPPTITSFTPTSGPVGTAVTITGSNFTGTTSVRFNGTAAAFSVTSNTQINATIPPAATTGKISITNPDGTATSSGDFTVTHPPTITSFTPTTGPVGTAVTITGSNFTGTTSVRFNGAAAAFTVASGTQINTTVPPAATSGKISVTNPEGTATSAGDFIVTIVTRPPTITSFTPTSGPVGIAVTITGNNFTGTTSVRFDGTSAVFTVTSNTQINATVPAAATSGKISVTNPEGSATSAGDFTVTRPPTITSFTPTSGPMGTAVTITGNNFTGTTSVRFNGTAAVFTVTSNTQINATVPAAATSGKISVTNPDGTAMSAGDFTVTHPPTITSFTPTTGPVGTAVTITGNNFTGTTSVRFNGMAAAFTVASNTQINTSVPSGATTGRISVTSPDGTATSSGDFTVTRPPSITSFTPTSGPVGTAVTITGNNFTGTTSVRFNGTTAVFIVVSNTQINTTVPAGAFTGRLSVTNPDGSASSSSDFIVTHPPVIAFFTPISGPVGTAVTISGSNFAAATSVRFNGTSAAFTASSTQINATVPSGAATGRISVTNPDGTATSSLDFAITYPPAIGSFAPTSGPVGTPVTIVGSEFTTATSVRFNGTAAVFSVATSTRINATVPAAATTGKISVTNPDGTATSTDDFTVTRPPAISSFSPSNGPAGTPVTIVGSNFTGTTSVRFNGTAAAFTVASSTRINATVPAGATSGKISVTNPDGSATSSSDFTITRPPAISSFTPTSGPVGTPVTIVGNNFTGTTSVRFGGTTAAFTVASGTQIDTTVPSGATTGKISVTNGDGTATSASDFTVTRPPAIGSFTPTSGPVGTPVTIVGNNFTGTASVRFNGTAAVFTVASSTQIDTSVPSGATSGKISVTNPDGSATSAGDFTVTRPPSIASFAPTSGPVGTSVTILGSNFAGTTSVRFGGTTAAFTVASGTQIDTTVPSGATTGKISVTSGDGTATSASDFTVTRPPAISSFAPTSGPVGTLVTIVGSNFTGTTSVRFNGAMAVYTVASSTQINAMVPPTATSGKIGVINPDGSATSASDFTVTRPPSISTFSPTSGPVGMPVTIVGNNFTGTTSVRFNGTLAVYTVASSTHIDAVVPLAATTGKISVTNADGSATSAGDFMVTHPPSITSFTPVSGPVGTTVTITGSNCPGTTGVKFNGTVAAFSVLSSTQISATVPTAASSGKISVTNPDGSATSSSDFTVLPAPTILAFSPVAGPIGTTVSLMGSGFTGASRVEFHGAAAAFRVVSDAQVDAEVPFTATTGRIVVTTPGGTVTSSADFLVGECRSDIALEMWPPNHKYVDFDLAALLGLPAESVGITAMTQDEPCDPGECDGYGIGTCVARLRSERDGSGNGRVYRIRYSVYEGACSGVVTITVPHDQGGMPAVDDGQLFLSYVGCP